MAICRFYQQGYCKFGDSCRFEHPGANRQPQNTNRFGALNGAPSSAMGGQQENPYNISKDVIQRDLAEDRPTWILSAYGPGKDAPEQLFGGYPREQSPEEIRLHYLQAVMAGNPQGAINEIDALNQNALQQIQTALGNLDGAVQFIVDAGNKHPNRRDICQQGTLPGGTTGEFAVGKPRNPAFGGAQPAAFGAPASNAFGAPSQPVNPFGGSSQPAAGGFGQPSALGQKPNPFGTQPAATPAFGQPSQPVSAFGQSSALGAKPNPFGAPAFGQPAQPAQSPFGQPSQASSAPAFGRPSQPGSTPAFGQPSLPASGSAFGQPSQPSTGSPFGQPSQANNAFGQASGLGQKPNPWGAPAGPSPSSPFGNAGTQQPQPGAQNPFGQTTQSQQNATPFGQPAPAQPAANPFGQPSAPSPFGQQQPAQPSPFGQQQPAAQTNPFGAAPSNPMDTTTSSTPGATNPFGAPKLAASNPFGQPAPSAFGAQPNSAAAPSNPYPPTAAAQHPPITSYASHDPATNALTMFKGRAVTYVQPTGPGNEQKKPVPAVRLPDGSAAKVWFPDGPPAYTADTEASDPGVYQRPEVVEAWRTFRSRGVFADGVMPEVPPMREWCTWDF